MRGSRETYVRSHRNLAMYASACIDWFLHANDTGAPKIFSPKIGSLTSSNSTFILLLNIRSATNGLRRLACSRMSLARFDGVDDEFSVTRTGGSRIKQDEDRTLFSNPRRSDVNAT